MGMLTSFSLSDMIMIVAKSILAEGCEQVKNSGTNKNIFLQFVLTYCIIILLMLVCLLPIFLSLQRLETEKAVSQLEE